MSMRYGEISPTKPSPRDGHELQPPASAHANSAANTVALRRAGGRGKGFGSGTPGRRQGLAIIGEF
jgi:hypothetical protein